MRTWVRLGARSGRGCQGSPADAGSAAAALAAAEAPTPHNSASRAGTPRLATAQTVWSFVTAAACHARYEPGARCESAACELGVPVPPGA